jgi:hypothetical protein
MADSLTIVDVAAPEMGSGTAMARAQAVLERLGSRIREDERWAFGRGGSVPCGRFLLLTLAGGDSPPRALSVDAVASRKGWPCELDDLQRRDSYAVTCAVSAFYVHVRTSLVSRALSECRTIAPEAALNHIRD